MQHVAIDLGSKESQICIRRSDGSILDERKYPTRKLVDLVATWEPSRVVMETCSEAFKIADAAKAAGHQVRVVPGTLVRLLGVGERGIKNDQRDAQQLSKASWQTDVPSVHIPSAAARELRSICGARDVLIDSARKLTNNIRGWVRTQVWRLRPCSARTLGERLRTHASSLDRTLPEHVERQLKTLSLLLEQLDEATAQLARLAHEDPVCRRLMTIPGVGPITAVRFLAVIDDPARFSSAHRVQSYLGLTPGENSSSERERRTGITKAGPNAMSACLVQAAWAATRVRSTHPMIEWSRQIAERRGRFVAVTALARKITGIMFALWRDGTSYEAKRSAKSVTA
jgi:transposase